MLAWIHMCANESKANQTKETCGGWPRGDLVAGVDGDDGELTDNVDTGNASRMRAVRSAN